MALSLDHRVVLGSFSRARLELGREHKSLTPYVEEAVDLTFHGHPDVPKRLIGALCDAHARWAEGWFPECSMAKAG